MKSRDKFNERCTEYLQLKFWTCQKHDHLKIEVYIYEIVALML